MQVLKTAIGLFSILSISLTLVLLEKQDNAIDVYANRSEARRLISLQIENEKLKLDDSDLLTQSDLNKIVERIEHLKIKLESI